MNGSVLDAKHSFYHTIPFILLYLHIFVPSPRKHSAAVTSFNRITYYVFVEYIVAARVLVYLINFVTFYYIGLNVTFICSVSYKVRLHVLHYLG